MYYLAILIIVSVYCSYDPKDPQTVATYNMFFESFGTSVVTESDMGGLVWAETWFESCLERAYSDICIDHEVHHGWWIVHDHDHEHSCDTHLQEDFSTYSEWHFEMLGKPFFTTFFCLL